MISSIVFNWVDIYFLKDCGWGKVETKVRCFKGHAQWLCYLYLLYFTFVIAPLCLASGVQNNMALPAIPEVRNLSDKEIDFHISQGEKLAEYYSSSDFLEPIINADKIRIQQQKEFNQKLIYDLKIPANLSTINFGVYNADIMNFSVLSAYWGIEFVIFHMLHKLFAQMYTSHIIDNKDQIIKLLKQVEPSQNISQDKDLTKNLSELLTKPNMWGSVSPINKKIVFINLIYALITNIFKRIENHFLLNDFPQSLTTKETGGPIPVSTLIPMQKMKGMRASNLSTHTLLTFTNNIFKKMGLIPTWAERFDVEICKEVLIILFFTIWYEKKIIRNLWLSYCFKHVDTLKNLVENLNTTEKANPLLEVFLKETHISFKTWALSKTVQTGFWNVIFNIFIAIPAWYRVGKFAFQTYKMINYKKIEGPNHD
jgi:hypothetical protein